MLNLVPPEGLKTVQREYVVRVVATLAFIAAAALVCAAVMLVPTYVLLTKQLYAQHTEQQKDTATIDAEYTRMSQELGAVRTRIDQLSRVSGTLITSDILTHIEQARTNTVTLDGINITYAGNIPQITVRGGADTRTALRSFVDVLKRDAFFLDAVVPVSDLARDIHPTFTLSLTLRTHP